MNTSLKWIKDLVPGLDCTPQEYMDAMTLSGSKVEGYENMDEDLDKIVIGQVKSIEKHPDADKLVICQVDIGTETIQIVTGAPNVTEGCKVPVVLDGGKVAGGHDGSKTEGGIKIKKGKLRGVESNGMMCSIEELGSNRDMFPLAPENGLYILPEDAPVGESAISYLGLDDTVVEYEITSNRVDCFSILGIAREAAATFGKEFVPPVVTETGNNEDVNDYIKVSVKDDKLCSRYTARVVKNIRIAPSPEWMQRRLRAQGIRPINNIVDITNYVMEEYGQPMHAYDLDTIEDREIVVRRAAKGEQFVTLDGQERTLDDSVLMICDGRKAIGIAGIMGGENSMITDNVKTMLFEAACFDGTNIRLSGRKIGLRTDASAKFEKGLDPNTAIEAMNRACQLIEELGAGEVVGGVVDVYPNVKGDKRIPFEPEKYNKLLGTDIAKETMLAYFSKIDLGYDPASNEVIVPSWRQDLECDADLAEEVARFFGYDKIPTTLPSGEATTGKLTFKLRIEAVAREIAEFCGFSQGMTYSFNGMLTSLSTNFNRRNKNVRLYELGNIYLPKQVPVTELPEERMQFTLGMYGEGDFFTMKGVIEEFLYKAGMKLKPEYDPEAGKPFLHPGRQANVVYDGTVIGYLGEVHPTVAANYAIKERVYVAVLDMPEIVSHASFDHKYEGIAKFPAAARDISMVVPKKVLAGDIEKIFDEKGGQFLEKYDLFDIYEGAQIKPGYKSIAYSLSFRAKDRNLEDADITGAMDRIVKALEHVGAELRK